ncbi:MAG TPA: hypothetical protein V6C88_16420 [Chroococcidiopsis sp.]
MAIANLVRLFLLTADSAYLDRAEQALRAFSGVMSRAPQSCPSLFVALDWFCHETLVRTTPEAIATLLRSYVPTAIVKPESDLPDGAIGLVCQGLSCQAPALSIEQLCDQLIQSVTRV